MEFQRVLGVSISPPIVEFMDAESEVVHQMKISVQNHGKVSRIIRFLAPATNKFRLQCKDIEKTIAPGLELVAYVEYYNENEEDCQDCVVFMIDEEFVEVPLLSYAPKSTLVISGDIDFGTTVPDGQIYIKEVAILNHGTKMGHYEIVTNENLPFRILPMKGHINPGYSQPIRFEFISKSICNIEHELRVELEGQQPGKIHIKACVVPCKLMLLSKDQQKQVDCIKFGSTYYGTDIVLPFYLTNVSPDCTEYVAVLDDEGEGQELGVDVTKSVVDSCMSGTHRKYTKKTDVSAVMHVTPCQGVLKPYEKKMIYFKFSPRFETSTKGWKTGEKAAPRQDYAFFLRIQMVGNYHKNMMIELALSGTALPVSLSVLPSTSMNFGDCAVGNKKESMIKLQNNSDVLPICYALKRSAHFHTSPVCGYIEPTEVTDVVISYQPNQIGNFKSQVTLDLIGQQCDINDSRSPIYKKSVIESLAICVLGQSSAAHCKKLSCSPSKRLNSSYGNLPPSLASSRNDDQLTSGESLSFSIAHPDDRAASIRPSDRNKIVRTEYTLKNRYTYIDTDYSHTDSEIRQINEHKTKYNSVVHKQKIRRQYRKTAREFDIINNDIDLGMKPAHGLKPPKLTVKEIKEAYSDTGPLAQPDEIGILSSQEIKRERLAALKKKPTEGLKAMPTTNVEEKDCKSILTPQELSRICIEPATLDFGDVCCKSLSSKDLIIANNIDKTIVFQVEINCKELRQTSPLSQVIPARSVARLHFMFESNKLGKFEWSVNYVINGIHRRGHLRIYANVIDVELELSTDTIVLQPIHGMPPESGFRKCITLINKRNADAEFAWSPVITKEGTSFTIRPAKGIVEAYSTLDCEVTFYPSYSVNFHGKFVARVQNGNKLFLSCLAEPGLTSCSFMERRLLFGAIPLNMIISHCAYLKNTSINHAFFKIVDSSPIPGMFINPKEGAVPAGGVAKITVSYKPEVIHKFDTQMEIDVLGWKRLKLRMGGEVELPSVDVNVKTFQFGGIYGGATASIPFKIINYCQSDVQVTFDLSSYCDFKVLLKDYKYENTDGFVEKEDRIYRVLIEGQEEAQATLQFVPTEVATYDFILPVSVNCIKPSSPAPSPYPASVAATRSIHTLSPTVISEPSGYIVDIPTPRRRVQATGLRSPLQLSSKLIKFVLPSGYFDLKVADNSGRIKSIMLANNSTEKLTWSLDIDSCKHLFNAGVFQFIFKKASMPNYNVESNYEEVEMESGEVFELRATFNPIEPGQYKVKVPLLLNNEITRPYTYVELYGELQTPSLQISPCSISMNAVPLDTKVETKFKLIARGFKKPQQVTFKLPDVELKDGSCVSVFNVQFHEGDIINYCGIGLNEGCTLNCTVSFKSPKPVSFQGEILCMVDEQCYPLPINVTADNCLLSTYKFFLNAQDSYHIICELNKDKKKSDTHSTETVFVPCVTSIRVPSTVSMVTNSTSFSLHTSSCEDTSTAVSSEQTTDDETAQQSDDDLLIPYQYKENFPQSSTAEDRYMHEITKTIERWYSSQCWSQNSCPLFLPFSLRESLTSAIGHKKIPGQKQREEKKKNIQTILDIVTCLCGKPIPGIPLNTTLPTEKDERLQMILWLYSTLLTFLRCQGAMVKSIEAEYLLDKNDYHYYMKNKKSNRNVESTKEDMTNYELISRKAWLELLLQTLKSLVLVRVTPQSLKKIFWPRDYPPLPAFNPDPLCSNVYSLSERILLLWLNHHYEQQRTFCWKNYLKAREPSSRWIVNFDNDFVDGLVLASLLAAHAPFLIKSHLHSMYTHPNCAEQCLHNALKVVEAFRFLGLELDILATDITEPNIIFILLLTVYLYQRLPQYAPRSSIEMKGSLHATVQKQVKIQNPSIKPLLYHAAIASDNIQDFHLPEGNLIQVAPKSHYLFPIEYKSRFLSPREGTLILVGRRMGSAVGSTLVFTLKCSIDTIVPLGVLTCISPCYNLKKIHLSIENPFAKAGLFKIAIVETIPSVTPKNQSNNEKLSTKIVTSKIDHGLTKKGPKGPKPNSIGKMLIKDTIDKQCTLSFFWTPISEIFLEANGSGEVDVQFLPFDIGNRHCSVLFLNKEIGEFLYTIEASSCLPLPSEVPFHRSRNGFRITSSMASHQSQGFLKEDNSTIYLNCEAENECYEELHVPLHNKLKERALTLAAKQRMSEKELKRRELTGLTSSQTILSAVASLQLNEGLSADHSPAWLLGLCEHSQMFSVEVTSPFLQSVETISVPTAVGCETKEEMIKLPITILPSPPGQYSCKVILKSPHDIRVYNIECTIKHAGIQVEMEFVSATHQSVLQHIPIVNQSMNDWDLNSEFVGEGFAGPELFVAKANSTSYYALSFQPVYEGQVEGHLILRNRTNGAENIFNLRGLGTKPLPIDTIEVECIVSEPTVKVLEITNKLNHKMVFQSFSDLEVISGPSYVTVLPKRSIHIPIDILTKKRGTVEGTIMFIYDEEHVERMGLARTVDVDSDDEDEIQASPILLSEQSSQFSGISESTHFKKPYRLWYSLRIHSIPKQAEKRMEISASIHSLATMELLLQNPLETELVLNVTFDSDELYGEQLICIPPSSSKIYQLEYRPISIGKSNASVIFNGASFTEFWYQLILVGLEAEPKSLSRMQCVLGRSCSQKIVLHNSSKDEVLYHITCSNPRNFAIECCPMDTVSVPPMSELDVNVTFTPSALGDHKAEIQCFNEQKGEQKFLVSGFSDRPLVNTEHVIQAELGGNGTTIIPFHNPLDHDVIVDVILKPIIADYVGSGTPSHKSIGFNLLLKERNKIILPPKAILDVPISYAPDIMKKQTVECLISVRSYTETTSSLSSSSSCEEIHWKYHIQGIPICTPIVETPVLQCRARERFEENLKITFSDLDLNAIKTVNGKLTRSISPLQLLGQYVSTDASALSDSYRHVIDNFQYELQYDSTDAQADLTQSVAIKLREKLAHKISGNISLLFEIIFSPSRSFTHLAYLKITTCEGGAWKYPLRFTAAEPLADDIITIESTGLNKEAKVSFCLSSQTSEECPYEAFFACGFDNMFVVSPSSGVLLPMHTGGTLITLSYKPTFYGKDHLGKLLVQTRDAQWIYDVRGITPEYQPPQVGSAIESFSSSKLLKQRRKNFIRENLRIVHTGVSSPLKGVPLTTKFSN